VLGDELPVETVQLESAHLKSWKKRFLHETQALPSRNTRIWQRKAFWVLECLCDFSSHFV